jgi:hypothetical protein
MSEVFDIADLLRQYNDLVQERTDLKVRLEVIEWDKT